MTEGATRRDVLPRPHDGLAPGGWRLDEFPDGFALTIRPERRDLFKFNVAWAVLGTILCFAVSIATTWAFAGAASLLMGAVLALLVATPGVTTAITLATIRVILVLDAGTVLLMASPSPGRSTTHRQENLGSLRAEPYAPDAFGVELLALRTYGRVVCVDQFGPLTFDGFGESPRFGGDLSLATADEIVAAVRRRLADLAAR